jgi:hypothetical protein
MDIILIIIIGHSWLLCILNKGVGRVVGILLSLVVSGKELRKVGKVKGSNPTNVIIPHLV